MSNNDNEQLKAEFALAKALLCVQANKEGDLEMGIASYPMPMEVMERYYKVFEAMDIAAPCTFDRTGDRLYVPPPALTEDQACFTGTFRADFNLQFERRRAFVRASWIERWEGEDLPKAHPFAERAFETLYTVSSMIGEAAMALATDRVLEEDAKADEALTRVTRDFEVAVPLPYSAILKQYFHHHEGGVWTAVGTDKPFAAMTPEERAASGAVCVSEVLKALVEGRREEAALGGLAAARAVSGAARAMERRFVLFKQ